MKFGESLVLHNDERAKKEWAPAACDLFFSFPLISTRLTRKISIENYSLWSRINAHIRSNDSFVLPIGSF